MKKPEVPCVVIQHSYASASTVSWVIHQKYELAVNYIDRNRNGHQWEFHWNAPSCRIGLWRSTVTGLHQWKNFFTKSCWKKTAFMRMKHPYRCWMSLAERTPLNPICGCTEPESFLKGFPGYLHTDAYSGYGKVMSVKRCYCWTPLRRKFVEALPKELKNAEEPLSAQGIRYINRLFEIESKLEGLGLSTLFKTKIIRS